MSDQRVSTEDLPSADELRWRVEIHAEEARIAEAALNQQDDEDVERPSAADRVFAMVFFGLVAMIWLCLIVQFVDWAALHVRAATHP